MDRQATFLLALASLAAAGASVSIAGWILFVRDRRRSSPATPDLSSPDPGTTSEA